MTSNQRSATALSASADTSSVKPVLAPPVAQREEDRVVLAGVLESKNNDTKPLIRQAEDSTETLLNPAQAIADPYGWMRDEDRKSQQVLDHLTSENEYTKTMTAHLQPLRDDLYTEMVGSIQETDYTTPYKRDGKFWYYSRTVEGLSYRRYCRAPIKSTQKDSNSQYIDVQWDGEATSPILENEDVYLDVNELAKDKSYCSVSSMALSPDQTRLAYAVDFSGDEIYSLYVKNLETGETTEVDPSLEVYGSVSFGSDSNTLYYVKMDEAQRPYQIYRRVLNSDAEEELLFEQPNELFWSSVSKTSDRKYMLISTSSSETSEVYYIDLTESTPSPPRCVASARKKVLYEVDHWNGYWIINSNVDGTPNMRLMVSPVGEECADQWKDLELNGEKLFDGGYEKALDDAETFANYLVVSGRQDGIPRIWVLPIDVDASSDFGVTDCTQLTFKEAANDVGVGSNLDFDMERLMVHYNSLVTPLQSLEIDMSQPNEASTRTVLKQKVVPGYDPNLYSCDRITVTARDGTEIPVSMVYQSKVMEGFSEGAESVPVHLYGYGSYGACCEADFSATRLPLMKRGVVYVCAHVRGGE
jgi:oligopeptidase B